jgi:hypothetical protein
MTAQAAILFLLGAASWGAGRYLANGAQAVQGGAIGLCGVAGFMFGMPQGEPVGAALLIYGLIGAIIFRSGRGKG